jgi:predicted nucleotidyltransferase component of viral defense system
MTKKNSTIKCPGFEDIKKAIVLGLFSNDYLLERLVLKGGNALSLVYEISTRASLDIDLSIPDEFDDLSLVSSHIQSGLQQSFDHLSLHVFDFSMSEEPRVISQDIAGFWGGYKIAFKLIEQVKFRENSGNMEWLRRNSISVGGSTARKFEIDISKHEYTEEKCNIIFSGYKIYVYSPAMIVCEKLRAICQQIDSYREKVQKHKAKRARDFLDIYQVCESEKICPQDHSFRSTLGKVFAVKDVPLNLLESLEQERAYHEPDFIAVKATVASSYKLQEFEFYFQYTLDFVSKLEAFWNV